jgi:hypothetical protein
MVKFLLEHAVALDEKADDLPHPWQESIDHIAGWNEHLERSRVTQSIIADMRNYDNMQ